MSTHTDTFLSTILATTRATLDAAKADVPVVGAGTPCRRAPSARMGCRAAPPGRAGPAVIAEIKKASPSKGLIRAAFDPAWLARRYRTGGAAALSVLTDEPYFQGSLRNLELASAAAPLPCLRKDFMVDEYQIVEARAHRADAILLIAAALSAAELKRLAEAAHALALDVLVEVHTADELADVLAALGETGADAIGVNNRDLKTFDVSQETSLALVDQIPASVVRVTESGISTPEDIAAAAQGGIRCVPDRREPDAPARSRRGLGGIAQRRGRKSMSLWIKICANTSLADAQLAADAGADAVGFVFAPSPRRVTAEQAAKIVAQLPDGARKDRDFCRCGV